MKVQKFNRRDFLAKAAGASVVIPAIIAGRTSVQAQVPRPPSNVRIGGSGKPVLSWSDFSYVGSFLMPVTVNRGADETGFSNGLTHRYYGDTLHFFSVATRGVGVYDVVCPALKTSAYDTAAEYRWWGDITGGKKYSGMGSSGTHGLWWDNVDQRMYWNHGNSYNTAFGDDPSLGYSNLVFTPGAESVEGVGTWRFTGRGCKATQGGCTPIPDWFARSFCAGRRIGVGFGGPRSALVQGPAHMGPALCAVDPPSIRLYPDRSAIPYTNLVGYPFGAGAYGPPNRCTRSANYINDPVHRFDDPPWNPRGSEGYIQWSDILTQGGVWIDTEPTGATSGKSSFMMFAWLSTGTVGYVSSDETAEGGEHVVFIYDTADLAAVAQGRKEQYAIQPTHTAIRLPGCSYPLPGFDSGGPSNRLSGATFDLRTKRLYLLVSPSNLQWGQPYVHCYQLP